jgi:hypothetical protein
MTSRIVPTNIDGTFPVAGQDNSSQGFRDNFTNIKNNFTFARNEISDLQEKVLLKSALDGTTLSNDMSGTQLIRPQLSAWTQSYINLTTVGGTVNINYESGSVQRLETSAPTTLSFINWPTSGYGVVRLWIKVTDLTHTVTLPSSVTLGIEDLMGFNSTTRTIQFDRPGDYYFDFSSADGGSSFLIQDLTRNRDNKRTNAESFFANLVAGQTFFANTNHKTYLLDTISSATIANAIIRIPSAAADGEEIRLSFLAPITSVNVFANSTPIKWIPSGIASSGNTVVRLVFDYSIIRGNVWYRM